MTLAAMWTESISSGPRTLCFASDSRTSPGPIEGVSKVLLFARPDVAAVWAGDFRYAALLANHLDVALSATTQMRERDVDVARLFRAVRAPVHAHLSATIDSSIQSFHINHDAQDPVRMTMLIGGYSIVQGEFVAMRISWDQDRSNWRVSVSSVDPTHLAVIGDQHFFKPSKWLARKIRAHRSQTATDWRLEPLAAIDSFRRRPEVPTIGGDLQFAKAFVHGAARAYGVVEPLSEEMMLRGSRFGPAVTDEYRARKLLVDMSRWSLHAGTYGLASVH